MKKTNWLPWVLGGTAVVGIGWLVFRFGSRTHTTMLMPSGEVLTTPSGDPLPGETFFEVVGWDEGGESSVGVSAPGGGYIGFKKYSSLQAAERAVRRLSGPATAESPFCATASSGTSGLRIYKVHSDGSQTSRVLKKTYTCKCKPISLSPTGERQGGCVLPL